MHSNQSVIAPVVPMYANIPLTGQQLDAALKDPNSLISKDLNNAIEDVLLAKKAHQEAQADANTANTLELDIEQLEKQLAEHRKSLNDNYMKAFADYYKQLELAMAKNNELLLNGNSSSSLYSAALLSLSQLAELLIVVQNQLVALQEERAVLLTEYADNRKQYADALLAKLNDKKAIYTVGNKTYSFNPDLIPPDKKAEFEASKNRLHEKYLNPQIMEGYLNPLDSEDPIRELPESQSYGRSNPLFALQEAITEHFRYFLYTSEQVGWETDARVVPSLIEQFTQDSDIHYFAGRIFYMAQRISHTTFHIDQMRQVESNLTSQVDRLLHGLAAANTDPFRKNEFGKMRQTLNFQSIEIEAPTARFSMGRG